MYDILISFDSIVHYLVYTVVQCSSMSSTHGFGIHITIIQRTVRNFFLMITYPLFSNMYFFIDDGYDDAILQCHLHKRGDIQASLSSARWFTNAMVYIIPGANYCWILWPLSGSRQSFFKLRHYMALLIICMGLWHIYLGYFFVLLNEFPVFPRYLFNRHINTFIHIGLFIRY